MRVSVHDRRSVGRERVVAVFTCPPSLVKEAGMTVSRAGEHAHTPHMYVPAQRLPALVRDSVSESISHLLFGQSERERERERMGFAPVLPSASIPQLTVTHASALALLSLSLDCSGRSLFSLTDNPAKEGEREQEGESM